MSHLREIMKRLGARSSGGAGDSSGAAAARNKPVSAQADHVEAYARHLQACSEAMLQYEWSWWEQHLEALGLCLAQPQMLATVGGEARVRRLMEEAEQCRERLRQRLSELGLEPGHLHGPVVAGEHAWELGQEEIRRHWGMDAQDAAASG